TYYGDKNLLSADVFSEQQYFGTLEDRLNRHFQNYGRYNLSVADSSWDTWLDGYVPGAPYRKTNIYTEGNLIALMLDVIIMKGSENKFGLRQVCLDLYNDYGKKGIGYSYEMIIELCGKYAKSDLKDFFDNYVAGTSDFEPKLLESLKFLGLTFKKSPSLQVYERYMRFKTMQEGEKTVVVAVAPYSPAWESQLFDKDIIIGINSRVVKNNLSALLDYEKTTENMQLTIIRNERMLTIVIDKSKIPGIEDPGFYWTAVLKHLPEEDSRQKSNYSLWKSDNFR
ncbi:MAG: hypothetical protein KDD29_11005, partial [Flavobacteriales bacterium]|nr:hypothetical protein [Flavobacteriales bacterium]